MCKRDTRMLKDYNFGVEGVLSCMACFSVRPDASFGRVDWERSERPIVQRMPTVDTKGTRYLRSSQPNRGEHGLAACVITLARQNRCTYLSGMYRKLTNWIRGHSCQFANSAGIYNSRNLALTPSTLPRSMYPILPVNTAKPNGALLFHRTNEQSILVCQYISHTLFPPTLVSVLTERADP